MKHLRVFALASTTALLAACGGGGDSGAPAAGAAEGFWYGTANNGVAVSVAVLENGETWGFYTDAGVLAGALYGTSTATGTTFTANVKEFDLETWAVIPGTYNGTVAAKSTLNATSTLAGSVNLRYDSVYDTPASASAVAGTYTISGISATGSATNVPMTIAANGALSSAVAGNCSATGTVLPRTGGKNVYNLNLTFNGVGCALGNGGTANGILVLDRSVTPAVVVAIGLNPGKTDGFFASGTKQ